jgi:hypothetical protein
VYYIPTHIRVAIYTSSTTIHIIPWRVWSNAINARQWQVKHTSMDMLDTPTIPDGCMATKNGRPQQ